MEKATARTSEAFAKPPAGAQTREQSASHTGADFTGDVRPTAAAAAMSEKPSHEDEPTETSGETETRKDAMTNETFSKMEMPGSLRDLMKMGIEQARYAFENFATTSEQAMRTFEASAGPMGESMRSLNEKISQITRANAEANFALAMKLAEANDFEQALAVQTEHVKRQMDTFGKQIEEIREMAAKAIQEAQENAASGFHANKGSDSSNPVGGPGTFVPGGEGGTSY